MGRRNGKAKVDRVLEDSGYAQVWPERAFPRMGGKPSKGTRKDKRLKKNKKR